jgi:small GTP-binding protein
MRESNIDNENENNEKGKKKENKNRKDNHKGKEICKKIKIILLGESKVGKTSLINSFLNKNFLENTLSTLEYSFVNKIINIDQNYYEIHLWDTAGQERYRSLSKIYIKGAQIVIFVYDITDKKSFSELPFWVKYVEDLIGKDIVKGVAANKADLLFEDDIKVDNLVDKKEAKEYANQIGATFQETSAKENPKGFNSFVETLIRQFLDKLEESKENWEIYTLRQAKKGSKRQKFC